MAFKKILVEISRVYEIEVDEKSSMEFVQKTAMSEFNRDLQFGLISANNDDFKSKIIYNWIHTND